MGPVWKPLKLPAMLNRPMSPRQTAAFQARLDFAGVLIGRDTVVEDDVGAGGFR